MAKYAQASSITGEQISITNIYIRQVAIYALPGTQVTFDSNGTRSTITIGGTGTFQMDFGNRAITGITITPILGSQHPIILDYMFD